MTTIMMIIITATIIITTKRRAEKKRVIRTQKRERDSRSWTNEGERERKKMRAATPRDSKPSCGVRVYLAFGVT